MYICYRSWDTRFGGSDYSQSKIKMAEKNLCGGGDEIPLKQCDFRYLEKEFDDRFDAIVCLTTSLPHLHTDEDLLLAIRSMKTG